jgi:signal transduction histidine kinase
MRAGLRLKLMLAASALALVPLAGFHAVDGMRGGMRERQEIATASAARGIAWGISQNLTRGLAARGVQGPPGREASLHLLPLGHPPQVDGYLQDWNGRGTATSGDGVRVDAALHGTRVFLLLSMPLRGNPADHFLLLRTQHTTAFVNTWRLPLAGHGTVAVKEIAPLNPRDTPGHLDPRFAAAVRARDGWVDVELSLPRDLLAAQLSLQILARIPAGPFSPRRTLQPLMSLPARGHYRVVLPDPVLQERIRGLAGSGRRIWILDPDAYVLARDGAEVAAPGRGLAQRLLNALLPPGDSDSLAVPAGNGRLAAVEVVRALAGEPAVQWRTAIDGSARVVSAAVPVRAAGGAGRVLGAVVVEDAANALEDAQLGGMLELLLATGAAFLIATLILLSVSARMVTRLRELRDEAAVAIDPLGRVQGTFRTADAADEIGDLRHSFAAALARIQGYNSYLEQLARRLSHELRTPVAIVRSSLENLELSADAANGTTQAGATGPYLRRARDGVQRLDELISRMTEAARLEQAVSAEEREDVDVHHLLAASVSANADAFGDAQLVLDEGAVHTRLKVAPALVLQALDKLLANARDFREPGSVVRVHAAISGDRLEILVCNQGPPIQADPPQLVFDSMYSQRNGRHGDGGSAGAVHLGLGLYIVRLVAEGHGGQALARSHPGGVCIGFALPLSTAGEAKAPD